MNKCLNCKKRIKEGAYCKVCFDKEKKKMERNIKVTKKRREKTLLTNFEAYLKSGKRIY